MKQFVSVEAKFDTDGNLLPLCICREDGRRFEIDRVLDIRFAASLKSGGTVLRYTCRISIREPIQSKAECIGTQFVGVTPDTIR